MKKTGISYLLTPEPAVRPRAGSLCAERIMEAAQATPASFQRTKSKAILFVTDASKALPAMLLLAWPIGCSKSLCAE